LKRIRLLPERSPHGWTPYVWLVYLSFFLVVAVLTDTPRAWLFDGSAVAVFLVLYFRAFWLEGRALLPVLLGITAIGMMTAPHNVGASCFFIYAASFAGGLGAPRHGVKWLAALVIIIGLETWMLRLSPEFWVAALVFSLIVGGPNMHFAEVRRKDLALVRAQEETERLAKIAERERIARDLHDVLGHTLSVIVLKSELAAKLARRDAARAASEMRDVESIARNALAEVRRTIRGYRGERLDTELAAARQALTAAGVALDADVADLGLDEGDERTLALVLREAITNVVRHAKATRCRVSAARLNGCVVLTVEDDGIGGEAPEGGGLRGMRARLAEAGGTMTRTGDQGTRLVFTLPERVPAITDTLVAS
jgi:two-component system sensor histidine kinase DesK